MQLTEVSRTFRTIRSTKSQVTILHNKKFYEITYLLLINTACSQKKELAIAIFPLYILNNSFYFSAYQTGRIG